MIVTLGVENLIVINTKGAVLIADKDQCELIKKNTTIASQIQFVENSIREYSLERRPWGHYRVLYSYAGYVVKQIVILPMEEISLQKHLLRSEHWVVVSGRGAVENESVLKEVVVDDYLYIAKDAVHRIRNTSEVEELKIIEVQIGAAHESDIVRLSDKYGRK